MIVKRIRSPRPLPRAEERRSKYVIVELPGAIFRLHRSGVNGPRFAALPSQSASATVAGPRQGTKWHRLQSPLSSPSSLGTGPRATPPQPKYPPGPAREEANTGPQRPKPTSFAQSWMRGGHLGPTLRHRLGMPHRPLLGLLELGLRLLPAEQQRVAAMIWGAGWGGGGSSGTVKNFQVSPINPSTPTFVACVGLAAERGRIQLGRPPQPCREMGRR